MMMISVYDRVRRFVVVSALLTIIFLRRIIALRCYNRGIYQLT